jgi:hypothetical protein
MWFRAPVNFSSPFAVKCVCFWLLCFCSAWIASCATSESQVSGEGVPQIFKEIAICSSERAQLVVSGSFDDLDGANSVIKVQAMDATEESLFSLQGVVAKVEGARRSKELKVKGKKRTVKIHKYRAVLKNVEFSSSVQDLGVKSVVFTIIEYGPERRKGNVRINYEPRDRAPSDWRSFLRCKFPSGVLPLSQVAKRRPAAPVSTKPEPVDQPVAPQRDEDSGLPLSDDSEGEEKPDGSESLSGSEGEPAAGTSD